MLNINLPGFTLVLLSALSTHCLAADPIALRWSQVSQPTLTTSPQSIGTYTSGCISGAVLVPATGMGYQIMRPSRKRAFGHPELKNFIVNLGQTASHQNLGNILIGDLGQARGGPTVSGHRSHQTGLDVDIWFLSSQHANTHTLSYDERESWTAPSVLLKNTIYLDPRQWSKTNESVLAAAASRPEVDRIFVNRSIKRELCMKYYKEDWLRKIRPWWHHDDHFHVRLKCPVGNPNCQIQEALPAGNGCDAGLAWWFTEEAKHPTPSPILTKPAELPKLCEAVLHQ